jgi:Meiotically Up-regulated Gene 113 (MUG113) protein
VVNRDTLSDMAPEYVYVATAGQYVKIGASRDVRKRLRDIERGGGNALMPEAARGHPVVLVATFETRDALELERALHDAFADLRDEGEWFRQDERLSAWIGRRRRQPWLDTEFDQDTYFNMPHAPTDF